MAERKPHNLALLDILVAADTTYHITVSIFIDLTIGSKVGQRRWWWAGGAPFRHTAFDYSLPDWNVFGIMSKMSHGMIYSIWMLSLL